MQFREVFVTNAGQNMLARAAAKKERITWGTAKTVGINNINGATKETIRGWEDFPGATYTFNSCSGQVTSSIANGNKITLHCELTNGTTGTTVYGLGIYAKIEDGEEKLVIVARTVDGTATYIGGQGTIVKLFIDVTVNLSDYVATAVTVDASNYAQAGALAATNEAVEALEESVVSRWRIYKDYWEALEKSKNGEWFSISNQKPRAAIIEEYGGIDITSGSPEFKIINHFGPWLLCRATNYSQSIIGISHINDLLSGETSIETRYTIAEITGDGARVNVDAELLWVHENDFLYRYNGVNHWASEATTPNGVKFHRSSAGLIGVAAKGERSVSFRRYSTIEPGEDGEYEEIGYLYDTNADSAEWLLSYWTYASALIMGKPFIFAGRVSNGIGEWREIKMGSYGGTYTATAITSAENALIIVNDGSVMINGQETQLSGEADWSQITDTILAVDCASRIGGWQGIGGCSIKRRIEGESGIDIEYDLQDYIETEIEGSASDYSGPKYCLVKNKVNGSYSQQPTGFLTFSDNYFGHVSGAIPWPGSYSRMVNRNGFLLPYLD